MSDLKPSPKPPPRPPIWVDGRQHKRFDLRDWTRMGHQMARDWLLPHLDHGSHRLSALAGQIAQGRFAVNLPALDRWLPSRPAVAAAVAWLAIRMAEARRMLDSSPDPIARPDVSRSPPSGGPAKAAATISPHLAPALDNSHAEPLRAAIRAVLQNLPDDVPAPTAPIPRQGLDLPKIDAPNDRPGALFTLTLSHFIVWSGLAVALPVGLARALVFHLDGGDLSGRD